MGLLNNGKNGKKAMPANGAVIHMRQIRKVYDTGKIQVEALRGIDIDIDRGEFVAIMGPSGSGKSTAMNVIGCLDSPDAGEYRLNGQLVSSMGDRKLAHARNREIGFVFQQFHLYPHMTALQNVTLASLYRENLA